MKSIKLKSRLFLILFLLTSVVSLALFMGACNKEKEYVAEEKVEIKYDYTLDIPKEYNLVGQLHNEGLDSVFSAIKMESIKSGTKGKGENQTSASAFESVIDNSVLKFCKNNAYLKDSYNKITSEQLAVFNSQVRQLNPHLKNSTLSNEAQLEGMNPGQVKLFKKIRLSLKDKFKKNSIAKLKAELNDINKQASETLTPEEAAAIYSATSTAFSSYQYWMKNYRKWYIALHYPELLTKFKDDELNRIFFKKKINKANSAISLDTTYRGGMLNEVVITVEGMNAPPSPSYWDYVSEWWGDHGTQIVHSDAEGAFEGAIAGGYAGFTGIIFGPEGAIVGAAGGAITGGITGGILNSAKGYFYENYFW